MDIITKLTLRSMWKNKKRTLVTLIGVIISVAAFTGVSIIGSSIKDLYLRQQIHSYGKWHMNYQGVPYQEIPVIEKDANTKELAVTRDLGYAKIAESKNPGKPYVFVQAYNKDAFSMYPVDLTEGRLPENENELVISKHLIENGKVNYRIGDTVTFSIGERAVQESSNLLLDQEDPYRQNIDQTEEIYHARAHTYKIVGIIERMKMEPVWAPGYTVITFCNTSTLKSEDLVNAVVQLKNLSDPQSTQERALEIAKETRMKPESNANFINYSILYNDDLILLEQKENLVQIIQNSFMQLYAGGSVVSIILRAQGFFFLIIMIGTVTFIYNTFSISMSERSKNLGILASVGATRRQKRKAVLCEGVVVALFGIPIGFLGGTVGIYMTFKAIAPFIYRALAIEVPLHVIFSSHNLTAVVVLTAITILFAAWVPALRAARITPFEAIQKIKEISIKRNDMRTPWWVKKFFGFEGELALKNVKRQRGKYRTTVFSISISIILFLCVSAFLENQKNMYSGTVVKGNFDIRIINLNLEETSKILPDIHEIKNVAHASIQTFSRGWALENAVFEKYCSKEFEEEVGEDWGKYNSMFVKLVALDRQTMNQMIEDNHLKEDMYDSAYPKAIFLNRMNWNDKRIPIMDIPDGVKLPAKLEKEGVEKERGPIEIVHTVSDMPYGMDAGDGSSLYLIVSEEVLKALTDRTDSRMVIETIEADQVAATINQWEWEKVPKEIEIQNLRKEKEKVKYRDNILNVLSYGYLVLISAVCAANIFNMISSQISLRRREIAMLKSTGMDDYAFHKMLIFESIYYGGKALVYAIPISAVINIIFIYRGRWTTMYSWSSLCIAIIVALLIILATFFYSAGKLSSENIIENLRDENI